MSRLSHHPPLQEMPSCDAKLSLVHANNTYYDDLAASNQVQTTRQLLNQVTQLSCLLTHSANRAH